MLTKAEQEAENIRTYPWIFNPTPVDPKIIPPPADDLIDSLKELVSEPTATTEPVAYSVHTRAGNLFARLRAHNRILNGATRAHKQETADTRHEMDQTYLLLQNLLYERRHLEREIEKCRQFAYAATLFCTPVLACSIV